MSPFRRRPRSAAETPAAPADPNAIREAALKLLERRRRTRFDLTRRLRDRGFDPVAIEDVIDRLGAVGLVDDVEYARAFLSERWGRRAAGWRRIEGELRARGITPDALETARTRFEEERGPADAVAVARRAVEQAARRYASLDPRVRHQRLYALLVRRGFDGDVIRQALSVTGEPAGTK